MVNDYTVKAGKLDDLTIEKRAKEALLLSKGRQSFMLGFSDAIRQLHEPMEILGTVCQLVGEHLGLARVAYLEIESEPDIRLVVVQDWARRDMPPLVDRYHLSDFGIFHAELFQSGTPIIVENMANDPRISPAEREKWKLANTCATISCALIKEGQLTAYLTFSHDKPHHWTREEREIITEIAERTWAAMEYAIAEIKLRKAFLREKMFSEIISSLLENEDPQANMENICNTVMVHVDGDIFFNYLCEKEGLHLNTYSGITENQAKRVEWLQYGESVSGRVGQNGEQIIRTDIQDSGDRRFELIKSFGIQHYACFPLKASHGTIGTLSFGSKKRAAFTEDNLQFLDAISKRISLAMNHLLLLKELREGKDKARLLIAELEKADQAKNRFISILSHELRNPLASIMACLELMEQIPLGEERIVKIRAIARRQSRQLKNLVDDLLDVTRIANNQVLLKNQMFELNELITMIVKDHQQKFADKNIKLEVWGNKPLYIEADPYRLTQALGNLLHNAAKFTPDNGLVTVSIAHETHRTEAMISVQDTGRGIEPDLLTELFSPFMQVHTAFDRTQGGLGLGLAIVKGIVELHGGRIEAFSKGSGKGARFTIWLPLPEDMKRTHGADKVSVETLDKTNMPY